MTLDNNTNKESDFVFESRIGVILDYIGTSKIVSIPETIKGVTVSGVGDYAFQRKQITQVVLPKTIKSIGVSSFSGNKLTSITLPESLEEIGSSAFHSNRLTEIIIPNGVTFISHGSFANNNIASLTLPKDLVFISGYAFAHNKLEKLEIVEGVMIIDDDAFFNNPLKSVKLPSTLKKMAGAFPRNPQLVWEVVDGSPAYFMGIRLRSILKVEKAKILIELSTIDDTKEDVVVTVKYGDNLNSVEYKIGEDTSEWSKYQEPFVVERNDWVVARAKDENGDYSAIVLRKITNICKPAQSIGMVSKIFG
ncbi:leucine-rich repeat domain-containing protein [Lysinibacillus xylanilyticus]|uniref:leucine-rich repeat domain-containing protein n=1 Tax=Lysinibacillus xylanilyticus TaxID=582475 RepID=UPI0036D7B98B